MNPQRENQNVWFGIAMFLMGLVAGVVLTFASSMLPANRQVKGTPPPAQGQAQPPAVPQVSVQDRMLAIAKDIGLDEGKFEECIGSEKHKARIDADQAGGAQAGITGTPGNIIYNLTSKKGVLVSGARPLASFQAAIDAMMKDPNYAGTADSPAATNVPQVDPAKDHIRGNANAKLAVIVYTDYECPYCHRVHPTFEQILGAYGDKVMVIYRHFPLNFHADAVPLATGAECANELGGNDAFWAFTDIAME